MILTFIRHSLTMIKPEVNPIYWELLPEGVKLAKKLATHNYVKSVEIYFSSPQYKAIDTGLILAKTNKKTILINAGLNELTSVTNGFIKDYEDEIKKLHLGKIENINNGETLEQGFARFSDSLEKIVAENAELNNIGIVSHCNIMSIFLSKYSTQNSHQIECTMQMPDLAIFDWDKKKLLTNFNSITL